MNQKLGRKHNFFSRICRCSLTLVSSPYDFIGTEFVRKLMPSDLIPLFLYSTLVFFFVSAHLTLQSRPQSVRRAHTRHTSGQFQCQQHREVPREQRQLFGSFFITSFPSSVFYLSREPRISDKSPFTIPFRRSCFNPFPTLS